MSHEIEILAGPVGGSSPHPIPLPAYRARGSERIEIRPATLEDLPFIDSLQKMHTKMVGWMPTKQLEGKIAAGHVLVARAFSPCSDATGARPSPLPSPGIPGEGERVGYVISRDQYFKRDDVGIIYQLNVLPAHQRGLIGAHLLKAVFERAAYGCRLFCCWCAQDIAANRFWEAMGFVPLAFRSGGTARGQKAEGRGQKEAARVHIFWQKRIREGDETTPWWFPCKTDAGAIREDRIVLPIPPGTHWSDAKPIVLPSSTGILPVSQSHGQPRSTGILPVSPTHGQDGRDTKKPKAVSRVPKRRPLCGGIIFENSPQAAAILANTAPKGEEKPKPRRTKVKSDPRLVAAARELRDRWLEHVNASPIVASGKYDVTRTIAATVAIDCNSTKLLAA